MRLGNEGKAQGIINNTRVGQIQSKIPLFAVFDHNTNGIVPKMTYEGVIPNFYQTFHSDVSHTNQF